MAPSEQKGGDEGAGDTEFACSSPHWHPPGKPLGPTMHLERLSLPSQRAQRGHANRKVGPGVSQGGPPAFQENSAFPEVEVDSGVTEDQQHPAVTDGARARIHTAGHGRGLRFHSACSP